MGNPASLGRPYKPLHPPWTSARLLCSGSTIPLIWGLLVTWLPKLTTFPARVLPGRVALMIRLLYRAPLVRTQFLEPSCGSITLQQLTQWCPLLLTKVRVKARLTPGISLKVLLTTNLTREVQGEPLTYGWAKLLRLLPTLKAQSPLLGLNFLVTYNVEQLSHAFTLKTSPGCTTWMNTPNSSFRRRFEVTCGCSSPMRAL